MRSPRRFSPESGAGEELDPRKQEILKIICTEHIARAEPVGSEHLASHYSLGVRSATLRNEMAEMTDLGYLRQPHTSAGRVPSDRGYRFYVDRLMSMEPLARRQALEVRRLRDLLDKQVHEILDEACRIVAELTRYTSVATPPIADESRIGLVRLLVLDPRRMMVVVVMDSGRVEHQFVDAPGYDLGRMNLDQLQFALNGVFGGRTCGSLPTEWSFQDYPPQIRGLLDRLAAAIRKAVDAAGRDQVVVQGETNVLREPEFHDMDRLDKLLELLHSGQMLREMIAVMGDRYPVTIVIGSESRYERAREYSFVAARYTIGSSVGGTIGVFGPTRMRYSQAIPVVQTVAEQVSRLLTGLAGGV